MAQIVPGKKQEAIAFLKKLRDEILGEGEFEYSFLEDEIATMYQEDKRTAENILPVQYHCHSYILPGTVRIVHVRHPSAIS